MGYCTEMITTASRLVSLKNIAIFLRFNCKMQRVTFPGHAIAEVLVQRELLFLCLCSTLG